MKKALLMALIGTLALASCNKTNTPEVSGSSKSVSFKMMLPSDATYKSAAGTAKYVDLTNKERATTLTASGLKPKTSYLAHYHIMGAASTDACKSAGDVLNGTIGTPMTTDDSGALTLRGLQDTAALAGAAYINIHEAATPSVVPLCAPLN